jgi:hypothetical protein
VLPVDLAVWAKEAIEFDRRYMVNAVITYRLNLRGYKVRIVHELQRFMDYRLTVACRKFVSGTETEKEMPKIRRIGRRCHRAFASSASRGSGPAAQAGLGPVEIV